MGKVKHTVFGLILCLLFAPILVACSQGVPLNGISSNKAFYSVLQGEQVQLEVNFTPEEATNKSVTYSVISGGEYVTVDENGLVSALVVDGKAHEAQILVTPDYDSRLRTVFRVKILADKITLDTPSNLRYDNNKKSIVWDEVLFVDESDGDIKIANYNPCYTLAIASGDVEDIDLAEEFDVGRNLSYVFGENSFNQSGTYSVWVKSLSDDEETFRDSAYSQRYVFTILDKPSGIEVKNYEILVPIYSQDYVATPESYDISIFNKTQNEELDADTLSSFEKSQRIIDGNNYVCWTIPHDNIGEDFGTGEFEISVNLKGDGQRFFDPVQSGSKIFYQLSAPTGVALMENVVVWDAVPNASQYEVVVNDGDPIVVNVNRCELNSDDLDLETNNIKVRAKGNGLEKLDGAFSLVDTVKLAKVENLTATLGGGSQTILTWDDVLFAGEYQILLNDEVKTTINQTTFSFDDGIGFVEGDNIISVVAKPKQNLQEGNAMHYIESDKANLNFTKLQNPIVRTGGGELVWNQVAGATGYSLELIYSVQELNSQNGELETKQKHDVIALGAAQTSYSLANTEVVSYPAGDYKVCVRAIGDDLFVRSAKEYTTEDINNMLPFIKQEAPTSLKINGDGYLSWNNSSTFISSECDIVITVHNKANGNNTSGDIQIKVSSNKNGESLTSYLTNSGFGEYVFSVKVINNKSDVRYLNSEESEKIGFYRLNAPTGIRISNGGFAWDTLNTGISEINEQIKNKFRYVLQIGGNIPIYVNQTTIINGIEQYNTTYSLAPSDCYEGRNSVAMRAEILGGEDGNVIEIDGQRIYLLSSGYGSSLTFAKLATPSVPEVYGDFIRGSMVQGSSVYGIALTNSSGSTSYRTTDSELNGYWQVGYADLMAQDAREGKLTVAAMAYGDDEYYVNSNYSRTSLELYRMSAPTLFVDEEQYEVCWNSVSATVNSNITYASRYQLQFKINELDNWGEPIIINGTTWNTSALDYGRYKVRIQALSDRPEVISSAYSNEFSFVKLKEVDYSTLEVKNEYPYNKITWSRIYPGDENKVDYIVRVYQTLSTGGTKLISSTLVEDLGIDINPEFEFGNSHTLERCEISIQAVKAGYVKSNVRTNNFVINRLAKPTNLDVSEQDGEYRLSWIDSAGVGLYSISSNGSSIQNDVVDDYFDLSILNAGSNRLTVRAIIDASNASNLAQSNGALTLSSPESKDYFAVKLAEPVLSVSDGLIRWVDSNNTKFGYELIFYENNLLSSPEIIQLDASQTSYDMSLNSRAGVFTVQMKVLGNGENYIDSSVYTGFENPVTQLSAPTFYVENGIIKWNAINNATSYTAVVYERGNESNKFIQTDIVDCQEQNGVVKYQMPLAPLQGKTGEIRFTLQSMGTNMLSNETEWAYINSQPTAVHNVNKWAIPTGVRIVDGEITWDKISASETTQLGLPTFSYYNVLYGDQEAQSSLNEAYFDLSSRITERQTLDIKVCCVGTPNSNKDGAWINSDYTSAFSVTIAGKPILEIEDGILKWRENQDSFNYNDYEILIDDVTSAQITTNQTLLTLNTFGDLSAYSADNLAQIEAIVAMTNISSIKVRHKGVALSTVSQYGNYVNSQYSNECINVKKLADVSQVKINEDGLFEWKQQNADEELFVMIDGVEFRKITGDGEEEPNYNLTNDTFVGTLNFSKSSFENSNFSVRISYFTQRANDGSYYLNSEEKYMSAYRFSKINQVGISDDGLKLEWNYTQQSQGASNDKFIVSYKFRSPEDNALSMSSITASEPKIFTEDELMLTYNMDGTVNASVPFWNVGTFLVDIQVSSTSANVIPSEIVSSEELKFDKFAGGQGTMENPFVIQSITPTQDGFFSKSISATEQFYNIKKLQTLYFSLDEDVTLYDGDDLYVASGGIDSTRLCSNFMFDDNEFTFFAGGLYGNGHTIHNYQVYEGAINAGLFYAVYGKPVEGAGSANNNFFGRRGIINDVTLEIAEFDYGQLFSDIGFFATYGYGAWFVNCKLEMSDELKNNENHGINFSVTNAASEILYGGIVARLDSSNSYLPLEDGEDVDRKAKIINCVTDVNITLTRGSNLLNSTIRMGGIAGAIYGASVINCKNTGNLGASQIGGIVYSTFAPSLDNENGWVNVISGSTNEGKLTSYATQQVGTVEGTKSQSGGILGFGGARTFVVNCLQAGGLEVVNGIRYANNGGTTKVQAVISGIVGSRSGDIILMNCINVANRVDYNDNYVSTNDSTFYGLSAANSVIADYCYYLSDGTNYVGGLNGSERSFGVSEVDLKAGIGEGAFVSFGTINDVNNTLQYMPTSVYYPNATDPLGTLNTNLLYDSMIKELNLFYFDGTNYPILKTYTVL